jgi:hypothetical protein
MTPRGGRNVKIVGGNNRRDPSYASFASYAMSLSFIGPDPPSSHPGIESRVRNSSPVIHGGITGVIAGVEYSEMRCTAVSLGKTEALNSGLSGRNIPGMNSTDQHRTAERRETGRGTRSMTKNVRTFLGDWSHEQRNIASVR